MGHQQTGFFICILGALMCLSSVILRIWDKNRLEKYDRTTDGKVVAHRWRSTGETRYPCAVVEYSIAGEIYQCVQSYAAILYSTLKRAEYDWVLDEKYRLHSYVTSRCQHHVNPVTDWFPVGNSMVVHYQSKNPRKAYCGALGSTILPAILTGCMGLGMTSLGLLLMTVLA